MTTHTLDFEQIKQDHRIEDVADRLDLELKKAGHQLRGPCFSGAEGDRKLVITPAKGLWYSFALNEGGDVIKLVSMVNNVSAKEAAAWIAGADTAPEKRQTRSERTSSRDGSERGLRPIDYLEPDHPAVEAIGFSVPDAEELGLGFAPRGMMRGLVAVPLRTVEGTLVGYIGITEARVPKEMKW